MKRWIVKKLNKEFSERIKREAGISSLCADVLSARGFENAAEASKCFSVNELSDPFLLIDLREAADVINAAIEDFERICIYGDYDCDGITSTVMLYSYLECMGADVIYYIPERSEGYGLNENSVRALAEKGVKLIVTVDNGISAINEAELIYELGMKLVVTDHHQSGKILPKAEAVVDPHRPDCPSIFKNLCGAGVALKLIAALEGGVYDTAFTEYGELAALATVADIVKLESENRYIVSRGLKLIENSERCGIRSLIEKSGVKFPLTSTSLSFGLAPRINASGRFGSPSLAAKLLLTDSETEAEALSEQLNRLNEERKKTENQIINDIEEKINADPGPIFERVIVLSGENWHHGVRGIVASRILERFGKPCFILTIDGEDAVGSARSFGSFSAFKALDYCSDLLTKFGGHMGAGGFSLKTADIPNFNKMLQEYAADNFPVMPVPEFRAEKIISPSEITVDNIESLKILEPFGEGNDQPLFAVVGAEIVDIIPLGDGLHTKFKIKYGNTYLYPIMFRHSIKEVFLKKGDKADFIASFEINLYNNEKNISLIIKDYRKSGVNQSTFFAAKNAYEKFKTGDSLPDNYYKRMCPDRNELVTVYKAMAKEKCSMETLYMQLMSDNLNYCKLCLCADIFEELGFIKIKRFTQEISVIKDAPRASIESSQILHKLRSKI